MKKALAATQQEFESSSERTPEYIAWHRLFKREFTKFLKSRGMTDINIGSPNHFDLSGFFTDVKDSQAWYFSISDLRGFKDDMLLRTAANYKDFSGGKNEYVVLNAGLPDFEASFDYILKCHHTDKFEASVREKTSVGPIINTSVTHPYVADTIKNMGSWK